MADSQDKEVKLHVPQDLDYSYRDMFNVYVGFEEVIIEFGNRHRSVENQVRIGDRIVLSLSNANRLQQALVRGLNELRQRVEEQRAAGQEPDPTEQ